MKLRIIFLLIAIYFNSAKAQNYEKDWLALTKKIEAKEIVQVKEFENFEAKHEKLFEQYPDNSMKFYSYYSYALLNSKDIKNAEIGFKWSYHYATKSKDTILKHIAIYRFADFYRQIKNFSEAEKYYYTCMRPLSVFLGQSSREYTEIYFEYTIVLMNLRKYAEAKPAVEGLIYYYKTLDGEKSQHYIILLGYLANIHQNLGEYAQSIEIYTKLVDENKFLEIGDSSGYVGSIHSLGDVYRESGRYDLAQAFFKKAKLEFFRLKCQDRTELASIENSLALFYKSIGNLKEAEESFNASINIYKEINETQTENYCVTLNNKGDLFRELGRFGLASEILLEALKIRKTYLDTTNKSYGNLLNNLGLVYLDAEYLDEALRRTLQAKEVYENTIGVSHQFYGNCLNNLSSIYLKLNNFKKAEEYKLMALEIIEKSVGKNHFRYSSFLISTTSLYFRTNQLLKAERYLKEALPLVEKNLGKKHDLYARAQLALAEVYSMTNRYELASPLYFESLDYYSHQLNNYFDAMSEENQALYFKFIEPAFESYNIYLLNYKLSFPSKNLDLQIKRAFQNQILLKSLLGKKSSKLQKQVYESNKPELIEMYKEWVVAKNNLISNTKSAEAAFDDNELIRKTSGLEAALKSKFSSINSTDKITFETIKAGLSDKEAAVEIFRIYEWINDSTSKKKYGAIIVKKENLNPELIIFNNGEQMEGFYFSKFSDALENEWSDTASYRVYFKPINKSLKGINKVYISSDGIFQKINLSGLYNPTTKKYVQEDLEICNTLNLSSIISKESSIKKDNFSASLFGYPDYEYDFKNKISVNNELEINSVAKRYGLINLPKLPGTKKEVEEISKELVSKNWKVNVYTNELSSEENLRKLKSPNVLHIATHGYYLKDIDTKDKLFLGFESSNLKDNSFLRSGIILAGVGPSTSDSLNVNSENDGIVTAYEASLLNLSNTDLVVLSACQTGLGDDMGSQGVAGLQRSFAIAGAKNIIMSLWPVDDYSTQFLMTEFYKNYAVSLNTESSFRIAQSETKKKYPHPSLWAAFVLLKTFN